MRANFTENGGRPMFDAASATARLTELSGASREALDQALSDIAKGRAPSGEKIEQLNATLGELRRAYEELREAASTVPGISPDEEQSVAFYVEALRKDEKRRAQEALAPLVALLERYVSVSSERNAFADALRPSQEEARAVLALLRDGRADSVEVSLEPGGAFVRPKRLFMDALAHGDLSDDEGMSLVDSLDEFYPPRVSQGLMMGQYHLPAEKDVEPEVAETGIIEPKAAEEKRAEPKAGKAPAQAARRVEPETSEPQGVETAPKTPSRSATPTVSPLLKKKLGTKALRHDVLEIPSNVPRTVLSLVSLWPNLTPRQTTSAIDALGVFGNGCDESAVTSALETLVRRGYLERDSTGERYHLTASAVELLQRESVAGMRDANGRAVWPVRLPGDPATPSSRPTLRERVARCSGLSPEQLSDSYDLTISYLRAMRGSRALNQAKAMERHALDEAPLQITVTWNDAEVPCAFAPEGAPTAQSGSVLSDVPPAPGAGTSTYDHWFVLDESGLRDALAIEAAREDENLNEVTGDVPETAADATEPSEPAAEAPEQDIEPTEEASEQADEPATASAPEPAEDDASTPTDAPMSSRNLAAQLWHRDDAPSDEEAQHFVDLLFREPRPEGAPAPTAMALALLKSLSQLEDHPWARRTYRQLALACDSAMGRHPYTADQLTDAFPALDPGDETRLLAAHCQAMLSPQNPYDHRLHTACESYMDSFESYFPSLAVAKPLYSELLRIWDVSPDRGLDRSVIAAIGGEERRSEVISELRARARKLCALPKVKAMIKSIPEFLSRCFDKSSDLGMCMQIVADDRREEAELVKLTLEGYLDTGTNNLDEGTLAGKINNAWRDVVSDTKKNKKGMELRYEARKQVDAAFHERLETMQEWLRYTEQPVDDATLGRLSSLRNDLSQLVDEALSAGAELPSPFDAYVFDTMLHSLKAKLAGERGDVVGFEDFLLTGYVSLEGGLPVLEREHASISHCEPWRRVLRHHAALPQSPLAACERILEPSSDSFDNYAQLNGLIEAFGPFPGVSTPSAADQRRARDAAEEELKRFADDLEMAYAYNQIDEIQKERLADVANVNKEHFFDLGDFANWRRFLAGLREQVRDLSADQCLDLGNRLAACRERLGEKDVSSLLVTAEGLFEKGNYAVVEEYLNRFDAGERDIETSSIGERDDFSEFISEGTYRALYEFCSASKNQDFSKPAQEYLNRHAPAKWTARQRDNAKDFVKAWPGGSSRPRTTDAPTMASLLRALGISVKSVERVSDGQCHYKVKTRPTERNLPHYSHPIAAFGTKLAAVVDVLVLFGSNSPQEIMQKVINEKMSAMSIVILDFPMRLEDKRELAQLFHTQQNHVQFVVIDRVLALYLALHEQVERLPLLLKCALPFTYYQPFVRDGGPTPDEMFCGRDKELDSILDPGGACVVYGGRQLGKTALLQRAESLRQKPEDHRYAVYVNIIQCSTEEEVAAKVSESLRTKAGLEVPPARTLQELCDGIAALMRGSVSQLLLLLDECDRFLAAISKDAYAQLQPLVDLKRETMNQFKFVIAGLHNVCRAKNATENNGIFGQLGAPVCVKPLAPLEALQLISRPLKFLGFQVDRYPHLETILANTNYYPGIIQFFGHILVESMKGQYGRYYRAVDGHPPYPLREEQLGAIISQNDLNNSIKEKFRWSLELDIRYFMLARCIAMLYYETEQGGNQLALLDGFPVSSIQLCACEYDIACLTGEDAKNLTLLLDEMVEMGILAKPNADARCYKLRRRSFLNIIGPNEDAILDDIIADSETSAAAHAGR